MARPRGEIRRAPAARGSRRARRAVALGGGAGDDAGGGAWVDKAASGGEGGGGAAAVAAALPGGRRGAPSGPGPGLAVPSSTGSGDRPERGDRAAETLPVGPRRGTGLGPDLGASPER